MNFYELPKKEQKKIFNKTAKKMSEEKKKLAELVHKSVIEGSKKHAEKYREMKEKCSKVT